MCRLLAIISETPFEVGPHLAALATIARTSKEYQGHGWGCARLNASSEWQLHHDIRPMWKCDPPVLGPTRVLLAHARSAFQNEGIRVENNMPFADQRYAFVFNGELHGVRIREQGRIGAEKIFNFIKRFDRGDMGAALRRGTEVIVRRARRVRAMNLVIADRQRLYVGARFDEDPDYFTLWLRRTPQSVTVCSAVYGTRPEWAPLPNPATEVLP